MTTVWFLLALIAFPNVSAIQYKGYYAYHTLEECESQRPHLENFIVDKELREGIPTFYLETYCLEMEAFDNQLKKYKEDKEDGVSLGSQDMGA